MKILPMCKNSGDPDNFTEEKKNIKALKSHRSEVIIQNQQAHDDLKCCMANANNPHKINRAAAACKYTDASDACNRVQDPRHRAQLEAHADALYDKYTIETLRCFSYNHTLCAKLLNENSRKVDEMTRQIELAQEQLIQQQEQLIQKQHECIAKQQELIAYC